jgi:two-component system chemotaxis response regulator CheB
VVEPVASDRPSPPSLVVAVGASAGGVAALERLVGALPDDFRGAVCVVMHLAPNRPSHLADILGRAGSLPVHTARHGERIVGGHVYVGPPDRHLIVDGDTLALVVGPNENGHRPAVDALFRSLAHSQGPTAVGVVLSGSLDDGASGLREIKARGGRAAVQDPGDADYAGMPLAALDAVHPDRLGTPEELARWLVRLPAATAVARPGPPDEHDESAATLLTCPDCHGPMHEVADGDQLRFDCLIGHRWSLGSLEAFQRTDVENALWAAMRALEEQALLNRRLAQRSDRVGRTRASTSFRATADRADEQASVLRELVEGVGAPPAELDEAEGRR